MNDMKQNDQQEKQALTPMQKQAVLVCAVCAAAILLTAGITLVLLKRGKTPDVPVELPSASDSASSEDPDDISDHYQISQTSSALLGPTEDAGADYQDQILFLGDSNTVRLYANGLISLQQFCAREGIGTVSALSEPIVTFKRDDNRYTIPQAVAKMKPRRVVLTFGTNDTGMTVEEFIGHYKALVQAVQSAYPYTDIIVNTIPPVPEDHANYPQAEQTKIDDLNMALLSMCEELEIKFLNSAEVLKDETGYGKAEYYQSSDIHLKSAGLKAILSYLRTHAYETEDRRPDTTNVPTRAEYTPDPSSAVEAPSSSVSQKVLYQASYRVDKNGGGTLSSGEQSEKALLNFDIMDASEPIEVTAVPDEGYVFVKWSDGVTDKTRTDADFKQNMDVTAVFAAASIKITSTGKAVLGDTYTFKATLNGKNLSSKSIRWYANGEEVTIAAGKTTVKVDIDESMLNATFRVYATATYNDCTVTSNTLEVTVSGITSASSSSSVESESDSASSSSSGSGSAASSSSSSASSSTSASTGSSSASSGSASSSASKAESTASSASSAASSDASSKTESVSSGSASSKADPSSGKTDADSVSSSKAESSASSASGSKAESAASSGSSSSASSGSGTSSVSSKPESVSGSASSKEPSSSVSSTSASGATGAESKPASSEKTEQPASRKEAEKDS